MDRSGTRLGDEMKRSAALRAASSLSKERRTDPGRRGLERVFPQGRFILRLGLTGVPPTSRGGACRDWVRLPAEEQSHRTLTLVGNRVAIEIWVRSGHGSMMSVAG